MSAATTTANNTFGFDIGLVIKSSNGNVIVVANDIDLVGIGLALVRWFLGAVSTALNFILGWTDIPLVKAGVIAIWFIELSKGMGEELCKLFSARKILPWA